MTKTLKQQNHALLVTYLVVNIVGMGTLLGNPNGVAGLLDAGHQGNWSMLGHTLSLSAIVSVIIGIATWVLPTAAKETLVFWRTGMRRLPSSRAFSHIARNDPRINIKQLRARLATPFPQGAKEQTAVWYGLYHQHAHAPAVTDSNRAYLLLRDMTALTALLVPVVVLLCIDLGIPVGREIQLLSTLCLEYLILSMAARNAASRLVANVLSLAAKHDSPTVQHIPQGNLSEGTR